MRYALTAALFIVGAGPIFASPSARSLISAYTEADRNCRDSPSIESECYRRERLSSRLNQIDWCYGRKGEGRSDFVWHRCGVASLRLDDMRPD